MEKITSGLKRMALSYICIGYYAPTSTLFHSSFEGQNQVIGGQFANDHFMNVQNDEQLNSDTNEDIERNDNKSRTQTTEKKNSTSYYQLNKSLEPLMEPFIGEYHISGENIPSKRPVGRPPNQSGNQINRVTVKKSKSESQRVQQRQRQHQRQHRQLNDNRQLYQPHNNNLQQFDSQQTHQQHKSS